MKQKYGNIQLAKAFFLAAWMLLMTFLPFFSVATPVKADGKITIRLHYSREDGIYEDWSVWLWEEGFQGSDYSFTDEGGDMVTTMDVTPGTTTVYFIIRQPNWVKDIEADQAIDISDLISGTIDVYVESGVEGCTITYNEDCVKGTKLKSATLKEDLKTIEIHMTGELEGNVRDHFKIKNKQTKIEIASAEYVGNSVYSITVNETLDRSKHYQVTYNEIDYNIFIPIPYSSKEFEDAYTYTGDDLGAVWSKESTTFRVWAPTATSVVLKTYATGEPSDHEVTLETAMTADVNGTWVTTLDGNLHGTYYTYTVTIGEESKTTNDPYGRTTGINGRRSMVIDLSSTNPKGWENDKNPHAGIHITDAIIYETHIRDFTVTPGSGISNPGKYLGMIETGTKSKKGVTTGLDHIKELGVTHLHILPMYDFAAVDETRKYDGLYNWGYDPANFNVPEGSYSTDASKGEVRVSELKEMIQGLHKNNISVIMDVVYNHVQNSEEFNFNVLVPGYFSRINADGSYSNGSDYGNDTATERSMVRKYIVDSVNYWADEYHIDGFRFDLAGLMDVDTINEIVETVHEKHPDIIFYGEGWTMGTTLTKENVLLATQLNSEYTPNFAYFNDVIRDGLKGNVFDLTGIGFVSGATDLDDVIKEGFLGASSWCKSPSQTINYASCHNNNTLYDRLQLSRSDVSREDQIRMNNLTAAIYMTAQGVPFLQAGEEFLRSKVNSDGTFNDNSYNAGDLVNGLAWDTLLDETYQQVLEYYKGLIAFRKEHGALRLTTAEDVSKHVSVISNLKEHVLGFKIKGGIENEVADEILLFFNATTTEQKIILPKGNWNVCINDSTAGTEVIETISEEAFVSPISALVLVKGETTTFEDEEINFDNTEINSPTSSKKSLKIEKLLPILLMFVWASIASAIAAHKKLKK